MKMTDSEFADHLNEQLAFVDASCRSYDAGFHLEAKRLATHVRVLVHDTPASTSLLTHMRIKDGISYRDGVPAHIVEAGLRSNGQGTFPGLAVMVIGGPDTGYVPTFEGLGLGDVETDFDSWWTAPRMFDPRGNKVSRKQITLWLANKDGGAHVSENLPPTYRALARDGSMGVTFSRQGMESPNDSPVPAAMRQIAEEVRTSIRQFLERL